MRKIKTDIDEKIQEDKEKSSLRPADFSSYIGQKKICESLHIAIQSAKKQKRTGSAYSFIWSAGTGQDNIGKYCGK